MCYMARSFLRAACAKKNGDKIAYFDRLQNSLKIMYYVNISDSLCTKNIQNNYNLINMLIL